ncbi:unnamed protein product [Medioppia subpectinata]|uniref:Protein phosphatase 1 regulatory subunit 37 n=1 Tax=Medioppia subpectinata TaxID=1979941 RepID=A0A7R9KJ27_9ACAR|nr:unnamed protein product [Medioppia subpectinata]CAG2104437.1 unnamed protein product [Medioppia subpectinata]
METMIEMSECIDERVEARDETAFKSQSAPTTPTSQSRPLSANMGCLNRGHQRGHHRVQFPEDHQIVTGYFDAPNPYQYVSETQTLENLIDSYQIACEKQNIKPIPRVLQQLKRFRCNKMRGQDLILKGERLDSRHCEALEEILKRVLFRTIDLDSCDLDCEGASALFDMIEFYESASHLCLANNKSIGVMGWQSLCRTLKKTSCLQYLNLRNTGLNEQILLIMGRAMRLGSHLVAIHLENAGLYVAALKLNTNLRELYLGDNKICSADGVQIGNLLRANACLDVLDLRRNHIQDIGLDHICEGLSHQPYGGLKILNLSDNQITSRAMNHLDETNADNSSESGTSQRVGYRNENEMKPDLISHAINGSTPQTSCSWGSTCDTHKQSGRFSVSPVNLDTETDNNLNTGSLEDKTAVLDTNLDVMQTQTTDDPNSENIQSNDTNNETSDKLMDLPKNKTKTLLTPESPYNKNIRRMSSPNLSQTIKAKVKPFNQFKPYTHLESLDLKSSLPISPTFFGRFEFPDPLLLKLPPEVDDIISKFVDCDSNQLQCRLDAGQPTIATLQPTLTHTSPHPMPVNPCE